jgi:hypothetical protein
MFFFVEVLAKISVVVIATTFTAYVRYVLDSKKNHFTHYLASFFLNWNLFIIIILFILWIINL